MLELPGQSALSNFRLSKLTRALKAADDRVNAVEARFVYLVDTSDTLDREQKKRLDALLLHGDKPGRLSRAANS